MAVAALALVWGWRGPRAGESWSALLSAHSLTEIGEVVWLRAPAEGQWGLGVVEAVPQGDVAGLRDIIVFEGLAGGSSSPFRVRAVGNLTRTPDADDSLLNVALTSEGGLVASASAFDGAVTGVSLFDLSGDPTIWRDERGARRPLGDTFKLSFAYWQDLGRFGGVLQRSYVFQQSVSDLKASFDDAHLQISGVVKEQGQAPRDAYGTIRVLDGAALDVHASALGLRMESTPWVIDSWVQFAVNRARTIPWVGARKVAIFEGFVFKKVDAVKQTWYGLVGTDNDALAQELGAASAQEQATAEALEAAARPELALGEELIAVGDEGQWPPASLDLPATKWGFKPVPGEGRWTPWVAEFLDAPKGRPWPVYRTAVRVDRQKEYEHMVLIAMDMRQLDLHMQAGIISPRSTTGFRGTGEIPRDPEVLKRVLLAFNGGFKTTHGAYGVVLGRRKFVPQKSAMASLAIYEDRAIRMGTWPGEGNFGNYGQEKRQQQNVDKRSEVAEVPEDIVDLRQNLPPLVAEGRINPQGAVRWGGVVDHLTSASTPRSGVCIKGDHTLIYVWGGSCGARDLGNAMLVAGCDYGMHLDMNPYHTGIAQYDIPVEGDKIPREGKEHRLVGTKAERGSRRMMFIPTRYVGRDLKDFFYITWRDNLVRRLGELPKFEAWSSRGLPVASGGLEPLAALTRSEDHAIVLLGLNAAHLAAERVEVPEGLPPQGEPGEVQMGLWINTPREDGQGRLAIDTVSKRLTVEPIASDREGVQGVMRGRALFLNGALSAQLPDETLKQPLVAARTLSGDVVLAMCDGCKLRALMDVLDQLDVDSAVLLGEGGLEVASSDRSQTWKGVHTAPYRQRPTLQLRLRPTSLRARTGLSDFTGPLP